MNAQPPTSELQRGPAPEPGAGPGGLKGPGSGPTVIAISGNTMGRGDDELGQVLLRTHLHALGDVTPKPHVLIFYNSGVMLAAQGSSALDDLRTLVNQGARLLLCGTCVAHFGLKEKVAAGEVSNMYEISETMMRAGKVINL